MTRTILLADDSVTIQKVVELTFLEQNVDVVAVGSGDDALERFETVRPDLVIADVHMPGADGLEVCRRVKHSSPETPVLLLVGTFEPFESASVDEVGAQGFLKKPFDSQELLRVALELMGRDGGSAEEDEVMDSQQPESAVEIAGGSVESADRAVDRSVEEPEVEAAAPASGAGAELSDADVERIARRVVELMSDKAVRDVAWEVVPDLAELLIRDRLRELESQAD